LRIRICSLRIFSMSGSLLPTRYPEKGLFALIFATGTEGLDWIREPWRSSVLQMWAYRPGSAEKAPLKVSCVVAPLVRTMIAGHSMSVFSAASARFGSTKTFCSDHIEPGRVLAGHNSTDIHSSPCSIKCHGEHNQICFLPAFENHNWW